MTKLIILIFATILFLCCKRPPAMQLAWGCNCKEQADAAKWVGEHIGTANNMSDEEMEDVIAQLQKTAIQLHCKRRMFMIAKSDGGSILSVPADSCLILYDY